MKRIAILSLAFLILLNSFALASTSNQGNMPTNNPPKFSDVPKSFWAYNYIDALAAKGIISGYTDGTYKPDKEVTRGELAKILVAAFSLNIKEVDNSSFIDVKTSDWYSHYIEAVKDYLNGYNYSGLSMYLPDNTATREDIAVSIVKLKKYDTENADLDFLKAKFSDYDDISDSAKKYVAVAVEKGIISGYSDGTFGPEKSITRAETASILCRATQNASTNNNISTDSSSKAYKISTIANAYIYTPTKRACSDSIATNGEDIFTYQNDYGIYKISRKTGDSTKLLELNDWFDKQSESSNSSDIYRNNWNFSQLYYSKNTNSLYLLLKIDNKVGNCLFVYKNSTFHLVAKGLSTYRLLCDDDHNTVACYEDGSMDRIDLTSGKETLLSNNKWANPILSARFYSNAVYFGNDKYIIKFDLNTKTESKIKELDTDQIYFSNGFVYCPESTLIKEFTFEGEQKASIYYANVDLQDKLTLSDDIGYFYDYPNTNKTSNHDFFIYDTKASAFRFVTCL